MARRESLEGGMDFVNCPFKNDADPLEMRESFLIPATFKPPYNFFMVWDDGIYGI